MAGTVVGTPNSPPSVDADWSKVINNYVVGGKGQNGISLTEWAVANTAKPTIASGSSIEVNGSFVTFTATTIGDDGSLVTGTIYLYIDITTTPGTALPKFTNTAPVWDDAKGGFYRSGDRYTGHQMEWDGASAYTEKTLRAGNADKHINIFDGPDGVMLNANTPAAWKGTYGSHAIGSSSSWVIPAGAYLFANNYLILLQVHSGSSWVPSSVDVNFRGGFGGFVVSDGVNMRLRSMNAVSSTTMYYRKIW